MAEGATTLKGLRAQIAAAAQAQAEERRSLAGNSPGPTGDTLAKPQGCKPVIDGSSLRVDDRLRVAKERREEAERQQALRESQIMERERKAKLQVERQLEERQKKLEEQRRKEEQKRLAVEEKRKQKQEEEKEHYEAVMRRTLERSQRLEQRQKRWSWGGQSPDQDSRAARRPQAGTVDEGVLSRLLTPTQASLARSKSAALLSAEGTDAPECHLCPRSASASPLPPPRGPVRSRSIDRQKKSGMTTSVSADGALDPSLKDKSSVSPGGKQPSCPSSTLGRNRSPSPAPNPAPKRTPSPSAAKQSPRMRPPSPGAMKQRPPSPQPTSAKPPPIQKPALTPTGPPTLRKRDSKTKDHQGSPTPVQPLAPQPSDASKTKEKDESKGGTGTNSAAEAAKILAENRRLMREQKEREEQLRIQREEEEKLRKEEENRQQEEARLKRLEEEKKLAEERKIKEEEEARLAEEEKVRLAEEEAQKQAELLKERQEAEAKALEEAERVRVERDRIMQQNQQERMERKKRIEEIMKRTRKGDQGDPKKDDDKSGQENGDEDEMEQINCENQNDMEKDIDGDDLNPEEPVMSLELCSMNGEPETEDKENNNGSEETHAISPVPKGHLIEGSEFLNDSTKVGLVSSLNGKSNQWSFEELIDVHSKPRPLMEAEDCKQDMINCDGSSDGTKVAFEDKATPPNTLHSSHQPIEAMSEI
ncbi:MAP7 domain-containing protein 2 isoform X15 [Oryzias melastigma]|uniref:MAP7 domain-containing protein 2 isoform X15 n=1 Tax=Oryzias melastigma TaxID=30732 RepID=UPI000CF7DB64|nr:MAP7 domain-containing protein 2 isoform X15 [Oryzias melastigma]